MKKIREPTNNHLKWTSQATHVDLDTGEIIQKPTTNDYIKINTHKEITFNGNTKGHIKYTNEWRKHPQLKLFDNNE